MKQTSLKCYALNKRFVWVIQPWAYGNYRSHNVAETEMASQRDNK